MGVRAASDGKSRFFVVWRHSLLCVRRVLLFFGVGATKAVHCGCSAWLWALLRLLDFAASRWKRAEVSYAGLALQSLYKW